MTPEQVSGRLMAHELVCAERYTNLKDRIGRVEKIIISVFATVICALAVICWQLLLVASKLS